MLTRLFSFRTRFKALALFRGLSIFTALLIIELLVIILSTAFLPTPLALSLQILLPLILVQSYALWTHIILTYPSKNSLWQRIPPFTTTIRATGPRSRSS
jgi:hypothetical protein